MHFFDKVKSKKFQELKKFTCQCFGIQFNSIQFNSTHFNSIQFDSIRCILKMESKNSYLITLKDIIDWDVDDLSKMIV